jgi:SAM-dependent methyltransferase
VDEARFNELGPWICQFRVGERVVGGTHDPASDDCVSRFAERLPPPGRVLELGPLEGGHTFDLAARGYDVLALEGRQDNLRRARFMQEALGVRNVEFRPADLETFELAHLGRFDACFCVGLLYHLPNPWFCLAQVARVTGRLFVWTHYARAEEATQLGVIGVMGKSYPEHGLADPLSGLSESSFWADRAGVLRLMRQAGFDQIEVIDEETHPAGPAIVLWATAPGESQ